MRVSEEGLYEVTEGEIYITNPITQEKLLFLMSKDEKIVIRSMLEQDIKASIRILPNTTSKERRKRMSVLWDVIPLPESELYFYVVEKVIENNKNIHPYAREREIVGVGVREGQNLQFNMIKVIEKELLDELPEMIHLLAEEFGIKGVVEYIK